MSRRGTWLAVGVAIGAGGSSWSRRRLARLKARTGSGEIAGDVLRVVEGGTRRVGRRLAGAIDAGRAEARRRERELRRAYEP
ncbi:MAG: hypothetical protein KGJ77_00865, partial [Acidobacteriota bacterium]|nr:hypothetical protein [Acidobacteriota bacterium]